MVMNDKSNDKLNKIKRNYEDSRRSRYEAFLIKYTQKQKLTTEKQNEYKNKLKERSISAQKRQFEAALRKRSLEEKKMDKIMARKSKSVFRSVDSFSCIELRSCSTPGVFISLSKMNISGTAGFGKGIERKPDIYFTSKFGINLVNTSIYNKRTPVRPPVMCLEQNSRRVNKLILEKCQTKPNECIESDRLHPTVDKKGDDILLIDLETENIPLPLSNDTINKNKRFRTTHCKKVSFNASKCVLNYSKPIIKRSLFITTPETKKGILRKMSELSARQRNNEYLKYEPGMLVTVTLPHRTHMKALGDDSKYNLSTGIHQFLINEETNTEPLTKPCTISSITTAFRIQDFFAETPTNCGKLLETCEIDNMNRKLKLAQLHQDLLRIENETKRLNDKNAEVTRKFIKKSQVPKGSMADKSGLEGSLECSRSQIIANNIQSTLAAMRSRIDKGKEGYLDDIKFKRYRPIDNFNNSCISCIPKMMPEQRYAYKSDVANRT